MTFQINTAATDSTRPAANPFHADSAPQSRVGRVVASAHAHVARAIAGVREFRRAIRDFYEPCEFSVGDLRGYVNLCDICQIDIHQRGVICPAQQIADCDLCAGSVLLDRWGNCLIAGDRWCSHFVTSRRRHPLAGRQEVTTRTSC